MAGWPRQHAWLGCLGTVWQMAQCEITPPEIATAKSSQSKDWLAIIGETQPLAQQRVCSGSNVPKETLAKTVKSNLVELRARHDRVHGRRGGAAPTSKPGLSAEVNTTAPHQTFKGRRTYTPLA